MFLIGQSYGLRLRSTLLRRPFPCTPISLSPAPPSSSSSSSSVTLTPAASLPLPSPESPSLFPSFSSMLSNIAIVKSIRYTYDRIRRGFKYRFGIREPARTWYKKLHDKFPVQMRARIEMDSDISEYIFQF